jgi:RimJ/RimL family protein N-acetyltransferase
VRLKLRSDVKLALLSPDHASAMFRWMCDAFVIENIGLRSKPSLEKTSVWIAKALSDESIRAYAIHLGDQHVGNVVLDQIDRWLDIARISIYVGEPHARGAGVGRTALYLALEQAFNALNLHKVRLTVHARNLIAFNSYQALGFQVEGVLRDEFVLHGERLAAFYMGLLADEFRRITTETP